MAIMTPKTHPDHQTVGKHFYGPCWTCEAGKHVFYCDSYDPNRGFWMTRADAPPERTGDRHTEWRCNVSERAIGATFHRIYDQGSEYGRPQCQWGYLDRELLIVPTFPSEP